MTRALEALHVSIGAGGPGATDEPIPALEGETGVRALRPRLLANLTGGEYGPGDHVDVSVTGDEIEGAIELDDLASIARAFATLPEPWQTALWHRVVEQQPAAEYAPLLGRAANDAAAAVQRADAGLFEAYLRDQRSHRDVASACTPIIPLLGGSLRSTLSAHETRLVDDHLGWSAGAASKPCDACLRRVAVSRELAALLPAAIVPGLTRMSVERYRAAAGVRRVSAIADPDERRRRFAFTAIFSALLLSVAAAVLFARSSLDVSDAVPPVDTTVVPTIDSTVVGVDTTVAPTQTPVETASTTTDLALRPVPTGPVNGVVIMFDEPAALGFAPTPLDLSATLAAPGPVYAGGTGTIDVTITNAGVEAVDTVATMQVPDGVVFDALVDGPASCVDPDDDSARCVVSVGPGATERVTVRFRLETVVVGRFVVSSNLAPEPIDVPITAVHRLIHSSVDEGQIIVAGNTLMTCVASEPACLDARDGVGDIVNRWDLPAQFIGADLGPGWFNSSSATVDIGAGTVDAAYLFWSGDLNERDVVIADDGRSGRALILPPGADSAIEVDAQRVRLGDVDATQYLGTVDVTDIVQRFGPGEYTVGNVQSAEVQGSYAGWTLVVVTRDDTLPRRANAVFSPFSWFSPDDTFALEIAVPFVGERDTALDVVAFEGERGFVPEQLTVGGVILGDSVFDSTISGPRDPSYVNNFGIDIDAYDLVIDASTGTLPIVGTSEKDGIRLAVLALAVAVE